jgi:hypothetical protein
MNGVIVHVGPAKTGTTAIQAMLARNRSVLAEAGFWYPTAPGENADEGHPALAWELLERCGENPVRLTQSALTFDMALEQARQAGAHTLLLSAEDFSHPRVDGAVLAELRRIFPTAHITIVYGVRDPCRLIPSLWQQAVKWGLGGGEEQLEFEDAAADLVDRYRRSADLYLKTARKALGPFTAKALVIPPSNGQAMFSLFAAACGLEEIDLDFTCSPTSANRSLGYSRLRLLLELNRAAPIPSAPLDRAALVAREFVVKQLHDETGPVDPLPMSEAVRALLAQFRRHLTELVATCDLVGDLADLNGANEPGGVEDPGSVSPTAVLNSAMIKLAAYAHWAEDCAFHVSHDRDAWRERAEQMTLKCRELEEAAARRRAIVGRLFGPWRGAGADGLRRGQG